VGLPSHRADRLHEQVASVLGVDQHNRLVGGRQWIGSDDYLVIVELSQVLVELAAAGWAIARLQHAVHADRPGAVDLRHIDRLDAALHFGAREGHLAAVPPIVREWQQSTSAAAGAMDTT
jgi:hypothetical protein